MSWETSPGHSPWRKTSMTAKPRVTEHSPALPAISPKVAGSQYWTPTESAFLPLLSRLVLRRVEERRTSFVPTTRHTRPAEATPGSRAASRSLHTRGAAADQSGAATCAPVAGNSRAARVAVTGTGHPRCIPCVCAGSLAAPDKGGAVTILLRADKNMRRRALYARVLSTGFRRRRRAAVLPTG
jgi:hypothetical protein